MPQHTHCRICRTALPEPFLDFGRMPLANSFLTTPAEFDSEATYPLAVAGCPSCGLVQLNYVVPAEQLYRDYIYVSSTSDGVRAHAGYLAETLIAQYGWKNSDLVVEVASNDGTVLQAFKQRGVRVVGVEPARNIAAIANAAGIPTMPEFFNLASARMVLRDHGPAAAMLGRHVFAHVDDVHEFLEAAKICLADDGVLLIEVPYLGDFLAKLEFDTIYHEHLSYISLGAMEHLCREHEMALVDVEPISLHGGSVVIHMRGSALGAARSPRLVQLLQQERGSGMTSPSRLAKFAADVRNWKARFEALIETLQREGASLIGYGAAAKANTLLCYCPEAAQSLRYVLDRSTHKQGHYTPGTHLRVEPVDHWTIGPMPTHMVLLAWNFKDEIVAQMKPFADRGGSFIVPIPDPHVVEQAITVK
jgi:novobiocin biosynthesis protein NovU/D-mycarose 3-C-methyltransferase